MVHIRSLFTSIVILFLSTLYSNNCIEYAVEYSMHDGFSNNRIFKSVEDKYGLLWTASEWGLNCFNGVEVKSYFHDKLDSTTICSSNIQTLYFDNKSKNLWIGTSNGLSKYNYDKDNFDNYTFVDDTNRDFGDIKDILSDGKNGLWLCSYQGGLLSYDTITSEFKCVIRNAQNVLKNRLVGAISIFDDGNGSIWITTQTNGVIRYIVSQDNYEVHLLYEDEQLKNRTDQQARSVYLDNHNVLWVTTSRGLYYRTLDAKKCGFVKSRILDKSSIYDIKLVKDTLVWIGGEKGVYSIHTRYFHPKSNVSPILYSTVCSITNDFALQSIRHIYEDSHTNLWLSSHGGGIVLVSGKPTMFKNIIPRFENSRSVDIHPLCITENNSGDIFIGTDGDGILWIDDNHKIKDKIHFEKRGSTHSSNIVQAICYAGNNNIWAGTYNDGGLFHYNLSTKKITRYTTDNSLIPGNDIRVIKKINDTIWAGGTGGLSLFSLSGELLKTYSSSQIGVDGADVRHIVPLPNGNLWLTIFNGGIVYFDKDQNVFTNFRHNPNDKYSIPSNMVNDINYYSDRKLWIVTKDEGGGYFEDGKFTSVFKVLDNQPYQRFIQDKDNNIWLSSTKNIVCYKPETMIFESFDNDYISKVDMYYPSVGLQSQNGNIYFGGANGIVYFNPKDVIYSTKSITTPIFTDFRLFNKSVSISNEDIKTPLNANIITAPEIKLTHDHDIFSIHFTSIDFSTNNNFKYAYILEGADKEWSYVGERNFAEYRNVPHGKYQFKVLASNQDGSWSSEPTKLTITILPPFFKTPFMYVVYVILIIIFIYFLIWFSTYRMRAISKLKISRLNANKKEELNQAKLQFFTNISHEFRTPLTLIAEPIDRLLNNEVDADKKFLLSIIKRNSDRLLHLINQILDLRKMDNGGFKLQVRLTNLPLIIKEILFSFNDLYTRNNIKCTFDCDFEKLVLYIDIEIFTKCFYNVLSNAFKFTPVGGTITISLKKEFVNNQSMVVVIISDSGEGISAENINRIFDRFYHKKSEEKSQIVGSGIGLHLVKELINIHHGQIKVDSKIGYGSTFKLYFPADSDSYLEKDFENQKEFADKFVSHNIENSVFATCELDNSLLQNDEDIEDIVEKKTILVVDDETDIRSYLQYCLKDEYLILTAKDGLDALKFIELNQIDLVLTDIMMPNLDGLQLCQKIKSDDNTSHIPVVLLTAKTALNAKIEGLKAGVDGYVTKPFNLEYLSTTISSILKRNDRLQERYVQYICNNEDAIVVDAKEEPTLNDIFIKKAIDIVEKEMDNSDFNGEVLASRLAMSRVHLHRKLRSILDLSTSEFIRNIRLRKAAELLEKGNMTVSEVCYTAGFNSPAYFSSSFTKFYGISPKEFLLQKKGF